MTTCLITGSAGFIAAHLVDHLLKTTDWNIVGWDKMTYAAEDGKRLKKIEAFAHPRFRFYRIDLVNDEFPAEPKPDFIAHLAAETHVDRSILDAKPFIESNIIGTYRLLEWARTFKELRKFLMFSTDEIFGPADGIAFSENARQNPSNPYAATKAGAENLAAAWATTYALPVVTSHCCNVFGEMQNCEKYIPKLVQAILSGETVTIHADEKGQSGSRMYVYAGDVVRAIHLMLECGKMREKYNIPGVEVSNEEMAHLVADALGKPLKYKKAYPFADRPGWDFRYSILSRNLFALGWEPNVDFKEQLRKVVECLKNA